MDVFDRMGKPSHPDEEHLERYVMKLCTDQDSGEIENHLLICEHCHARSREAEEWVALMKIALPLAPKPVKVPRWRQSVEHWFAQPMVMAGYAAMAIVLFATPLLHHERFDREETVTLNATRGETDQTTFTASSRNRIRLRLDTSDLNGPLEAEIVDQTGTTVWANTLRSPAVNPELLLDHRLEPGSYWVRVNSAKDHRTLREAGLRVQ